MSSENSINVPDSPYKGEEFEAFIGALEDGTAAHWENIAEALGVHPNTIAGWRKHPRAIEATRKGLAHALKQMEESGSRDWRMWQERLKMLGINPANKTEVKLPDDPTNLLLKKYGLKEGESDDRKGDEPI